MNRRGYLRRRPWTRPEVAIWFAALIVTVGGGILFAANAVGPWVLIIGCGIVMVLGLLRYRAEAEQASRTVDEGDE